MKTFKQALSLIATALLFLTACELPTDENTPPEQTIVYLGRLIQEVRTLSYNGFFPIAGDQENNETPLIYEVDFNFPNNRIQFFGKTKNSDNCYFSRELSPAEYAETIEKLENLEFCELRSNIDTACIGCFFPGETLSIDGYNQFFWLDTQSSFCSPGRKELCNPKDFQSITDLIKPLAEGSLMNCQ